MLVQYQVRNDFDIFVLPTFTTMEREKEEGEGKENDFLIATSLPDEAHHTVHIQILQAEQTRSLSR